MRASTSRDRSRNQWDWDVIVIGGGAAGMMAAGRAAELGARVLLLEKNKTLGKKLLITGGGRCNVTNAEFDNKKLLAKFKDSGKFLASPFASWSVEETLDFFHSRNMPTKEEALQRVFPLSNTAQSVWNTLVAYMKEFGVEVLSNAPVKKIHAVDGNISAVELKDGQMLYGATFILATGGTSHPETGSTGDGYAWLRMLGHTVVEPTASLVPIATKNPERTLRAAGVALSEAKITLYQNNIRQVQSVGKVLFTHVGLSGPGILNMSRDIGELLKYGEVQIELDFIPRTGYEKVDATLQEALKTHANKKIRNALSGIIPPALIPVVLEYAHIDSEVPCNSITRAARVLLMKTLKHFRLEVEHLLGMEKAIITSGGVALTEIDFKTMRSLKYSNLYLVGDILNIDRPSGGYSLQLCWTTGFVAGTTAAQLRQ